ncbi:MAG TPA: VCBS repeat-containing protein, partial [Thermoanaerobaculia bacterium]
DLDSDLDFLLYGPRLTLMENREGTFVLADSMRTTGFSSGGVGDWTGDGLPDFAAGGFVYAGDGELGEVPLTSTLSNLACLDSDADGDLEVFDFYLSSSPFINEGGPDVFENDASGRFTSRTVSVPAPPAGHLYRGDHPPVDLDGDGFGDLLRTLVLDQYPYFPFVDTRIFRGTASGSFVDGGTAGPAGGGPLVYRNMTADMDGDGDQDVLTYGGYNENDGSGFFPSYHPTWSGYPLETADLDGDGDLDVLGNDQTTIAVARNQGGAFTSEVITSQAVPEASHLGDLDDDGDLDLVLGTTAGGPAVLLYENVAGSFAPPVRLDQAQESVHSFAIEDFDGDGQEDVLAMPDTRMSDTIVWYLWRQTSAWEFAPPAQYLGGAMGISGDFDSDGDRDFFANRLVRSRRFDGPSDGRIRQIGAGRLGGEPLVPLLGASGPLRPGSTSAVLHVSRARGGALGQLFLTGQAFGPAGLARRVGSLTPVLTFALDGSPGASGEGNFEMSLGPSTLALQGQKVWMHAVIADPSLPRSLASTTNSLELTFGN